MSFVSLEKGIFNGILFQKSDESFNLLRILFTIWYSLRFQKATYRCFVKRAVFIKTTPFFFATVFILHNDEVPYEKEAPKIPNRKSSSSISADTDEGEKSATYPSSPKLIVCPPNGVEILFKIIVEKFQSERPPYKLLELALRRLEE
jgi:hypothetical protein